jgi:plastocyanin domain-containing protein
MKKNILILIIVIFLILIGITGLIVKSNLAQKPSNNQLVSNENVQVVNLGFSSYNYNPGTITVKQGVPVRIVMDLGQVNGCYRAFTIPQLNIQKVFRSGDNTLEFTPTQKGTYKFSCAMGMGTGTLVVQ